MCACEPFHCQSFGLKRLPIVRPDTLSMLLFLGTHHLCCQHGWQVAWLVPQLHRAVVLHHSYTAECLRTQPRDGGGNSTNIVYSCRRKSQVVSVFKTPKVYILLYTFFYTIHAANSLVSCFRCLERRCWRWRGNVVGFTGVACSVLDADAHTHRVGRKDGLVLVAPICLHRNRLYSSTHRREH
jgi:hypothetical protein